MTRRRTIQLWAVAAAALFALSAVTVAGYLCAARYQRNLEYTYRRSFNDLSTHVSTMEVTLDKAVYANTATQQSAVAALLMQQAGGAKASLGVLPLQGDSMNTVQKFLTQVEDFSTMLNKKAAAGSPVTDDDRNTLDQLYNYAALLKADLAQVQNQFDSQSLSIGESETLIKNLDLEEAVPVFGDALAETAKNFQDYPTLLYDGPFSDHIAQQKPKLLEGKSEVTAAEAIENAADFLSLDKSSLSHTGDTDGNLPAYHLTSGDKTIRVTKQGGIVLSLLDSRTVETASLTYEQAKEKAEEFLQKNDFGNVTESYYVINDNICTIQFFAKQDGVTLYPDLIKVAVSLDNGDICGYNATGYVMNHTSRTLKTPALTIKEARKSVSPALTIDSEETALIPTAGGSEVLCYQFRCTGKDSDQVLVYVNADTGMEEQIFIVLSSDNGILTI